MAISRKQERKLLKAEYLQKAAYGIAVTAELESNAKQIYESIMGGGA